MPPLDSPFLQIRETSLPARTAILRVLLALMLCGLASADWVELNCYPHDCKVSKLQKGLAPIFVGHANQSLQLDPGQKLLLERPGWKSLEYTLPENLSGLVPAQTIVLEEDPNHSSQVLLYRVSQNWWKAGLVVVVVIFLGLKLRPKGGLDREALLARLEEEILEKGPYTLQTLGSYRLLEPINEGGMAVVYRAVPEDTLSEDEALAVKVLKRSFCEDPTYIKRWKREAKITSEMDHPNLVKVHGAGEQDGVHFIAMELLSGTSLKELVKPGGLPWREAVGYLCPVLEALHTVHEAGIVHRDINPANILRISQQNIRVIDFGIARGEEFTRATKTGAVMGTVDYLAPEQMNGELNPCIDQYAVGIMLYELLTGNPPFQGDQMDVIMQHIGTQPRPLRTLKPELPEELEAIVLKLLCKDPKGRYASANEAKEALEKLLSKS